MRRKGHIQFPSQLILSFALENNLTVFKRECVPDIANKMSLPIRFTEWSMEAKLIGNELLTPVKAVKGMTKEGKQRNKVADDIYSATVSSVRVPIEVFFVHHHSNVDKNHYFCYISKNFGNNMLYVVSQEDIRGHLL